MVYSIKGLLILLSFILLAGCAPSAVAPVFFIPQNIQSVKKPLTPESLSVKVTLSESDVDAYITENNFKIAIEESIRQANLFGGDLNKPFMLMANVYKASFPSAGFTMTSQLCAKYTLNDQFLKEVWFKDICYKGEATTSEAFIGSARAILAFNRANHGHMTMLITSLRDFLETKDNLKTEEKKQ